MANRQLVDYVRTQLTQRASIEQIRSILLQQGWLPQDVEAAIMEARGQAQAHTHKEHHTNFVAVAISIIIILGLLLALFVVVFKKTDTPIYEEEEGPIQEVKVLPVEEKEDPDWYTCRELIDYSVKHACYYDLNFANTKYDCDAISDAEERNACYRGKDQVLLEKYAQANDPVVEATRE